MSGVLFDHFIFKSRRFTHRTKTIVFALIIAVVVGTWWYFQDCAWGIEGPAAKTMKGRKWRKVCLAMPLSFSAEALLLTSYVVTELEHLRLERFVDACAMLLPVRLSLRKNGRSLALPVRSHSLRFTTSCKALAMYQHLEEPGLAVLGQTVSLKLRLGCWRGKQLEIENAFELLKRLS